MKKNKVLSLLLTVSMLGSAALCGCSSTSESSSATGTTSTESKSETAADGSLSLPEDGGYLQTYTMSDDKYRTYYEIFSYSFCDSNGDGVGDINGITSKLDYLNDGDPATRDDLGVDAIWLTPIMESPSYHKYNVTDYYTVDDVFGTNDDFKKLLDESHKRGINVIIDLVLNHTSRTCEWYQKAIEELKEGKTDGYAQYYHFEQDHTGSGWAKTSVDNWYYECQFDSDMPDLNLQNEDVRKEVEKIVDFWIDMGVDGFRLDAVLWFESETGNEYSVEDLKWLYDYKKKKKEDIYMVGECWSDSVTIQEFYKSGLDSLFNFQTQGATGNVNSAVSRKNALSYVQYLEKWQSQIRENNENAIDAIFISNHDQARSAGYIATDTRKRLNAALYILTPSNPFIYYGEEIEMKGSLKDPDKRKGMYWSATDTTGYVENIPGATNKDVPDQSVEDAQKDENSLLNFYKRVIALRNQNPEIARGTIKSVELKDDSTAGFVSTYNDSSVLVLYNLDDESQTVDIPEDTFKINEVRGYLLAHCADDEEPGEKYDDTISVKGQKVTLPAQSVIVLK